jgi:nucleotide-binding universal stress UspA family protein
MFKNLLVATDYSAPSDAALRHAQAMAGAFGSSLHALHVLPNVFLQAVVNDPPALAAGASAELRGWLRAHGSAGATASVERSDEPADEIVSHARTNGIDLIVMGTHGGRGAIAHLLMGSVAERVVRTAPCPVLTVHTPPAGPPPRRILVPTDFSAAADAALDVARVIARRLAGSLHLLHVMSEPADASSEVYIGESPELRQERIRDAVNRLNHRVSAADRTAGFADTEVVSGSPAASIADRAREYDLIVMGTHGRQGLTHVLMGSVAERVVRHARCPVMTVRHLAAREVAAAAVPAATLA